MNIASNVPQFQAMQAMPILFNPVRLDEGDGTEHALKMNSEKYHWSCCLMFNNMKLERSRKRHMATDGVNEQCRSKFPRVSQKATECFPCEKGLPSCIETVHDDAA